MAAARGYRSKYYLRSTIGKDKINLLKTLGPQSGLLATYGMLGLSLALVIWWEKHFFAKKARQNAAAAKLQTAL